VFDTVLVLSRREKMRSAGRKEFVMCEFIERAVNVPDIIRINYPVLVPHAIELKRFRVAAERFPSVFKEIFMEV